MKGGRRLRSGTIADLNSLASLVLNIANHVDEKGLDGERFCEELGMGYRVISGRLRRGVMAISQIQECNSTYREKEQYERSSAEEAVKFLEEIFGDRDIDSMNENDKVRLKEFVKNIYEEDEP